MACEVNNKEINSQCGELLVQPTYIVHNHDTAIHRKGKEMDSCVLFNVP